MEGAREQSGYGGEGYVRTRVLSALVLHSEAQYNANVQLSSTVLLVLSIKLINGSQNTKRVRKRES